MIAAYFSWHHRLPSLIVTATYIIPQDNYQLLTTRAGQMNEFDIINMLSNHPNNALLALRRLILKSNIKYPQFCLKIDLQMTDFKRAVYVYRL